jgi:hypothetical protein
LVSSSVGAIVWPYCSWLYSYSSCCFWGFCCCMLSILLLRSWFPNPNPRDASCMKLAPHFQYFIPKMAKSRKSSPFRGFYTFLVLGLQHCGALDRFIHFSSNCMACSPVRAILLKLSTVADHRHPMKRLPTRLDDNATHAY